MINENTKIVFIGDSISDIKFNRRTKHLLAKNAFPAQVQSSLSTQNPQIYFKGIASNRSFHVYDRLTKDCIQYKPDYIFLLIGVNDAWDNYLVNDTPNTIGTQVVRHLAPNFREILNRFKNELSPDTKVTILLPFLLSTIAEKKPFKPFVEQACQLEISFANACGYLTIDLQKIFDDAEKVHSASQLATDGVHPTELGHSYIAKACLEILNK